MAVARERPLGAPVEKGRHPRPDESMPQFAWPTFALAMGALTVFGLTAVAAIRGYAPIWVIIPLSTVVTYVMFSVAHEATHYSFCSVRWVDALAGRLAWAFVAPMFSLSVWHYVHTQHHRHANDPEQDPDIFATHGPGWQLPLRWALMDFFYAAWYIRRLRRRLCDSWRRPAAELAETVMVFALTVGGIGAAVVTGHFWAVAVLVLIPQRLGIAILGFAFDWLPHHGLAQTQRENRYRATRIRVGCEWLLTPLMLSQNYHLIHHLHPWLPFYRYLAAWRRNEDAYLEHDAALATVFGGELTSDEYRELARSTSGDV